MSASLLGVPWSTIIAGGVALLLVAVVGLTIRSIIKGDLVPRSAVADIRADRDKWEAAWHRQQDTITQFEGQLAANTEALKFQQQFVEALATRGTVR